MPYSNLLTDVFATPALTLDNETKDETGDGATLTIDSNSDQGTLYSYIKTTPFNGTEAEKAAEIMANGVGQGPVMGTNTRVVTGQDPLTPHYAGWVQDTDGYGADMVLVFNMGADETLTIPGGAGTYDYEVNWGDLTDPDTWEAFTTVPATHTYTGDVAGEKTVIVRGTFPHVYFNNAGDIGKLIRILNWGDTSWLSAGSSFYGASNLVEASSEVANTSSVTSMSAMMYNWTAMESPPDLSGWDTSSVTNMYAMMRSWTAMISPPDLSGWDVSRVTNMGRMMYDWTAMASPPDVSSWDVSAVADMGRMMQSWPSMTSSPDLSGWDVSRVTTMAYMMYDWTAMGAVDPGIDNWNIGLVTNFTSFMSGSQLTTVCYDRTLASWGNQTLAAGAASTTIHFGTSQYTDAASHALLLAQVTNIIDGGLET